MGEERNFVPCGCLIFQVIVCSFIRNTFNGFSDQLRLELLLLNCIIRIWHFVTTPNKHERRLYAC